MKVDYEELRRLFKDYRIYYPITQKDLAEKSGVSQRSIARFESGEDITLSNFIKLLEALDVADGLMQIIPDQRKRPSAYLISEPGRKRATYKKAPTRSKGFRWGDES